MMERTSNQKARDLIEEGRRALDNIDPNAIPFDLTKQMLSKGYLSARVDRGLAVQAVRSGIPVSNAATVCAILFPVLPIFGIIAPFLGYSYTWIVIGVAGGVVAYHLSRFLTAKSILREGLNNEDLFNLLRSKEIISFNFTPASGLRQE